MHNIHIKSTQYGQGMSFFSTNMHKFLLVTQMAAVDTGYAHKEKEQAQLGAGWAIHREPGNQVPTESSDSHEIFSAFHGVLAQI